MQTTLTITSNAVSSDYRYLDNRNAPETHAVRAALIRAIADGSEVSLRYGRGSMPGAARKLRVLRFADDDLFEAIQTAPEPRNEAQHYRSSCILSILVSGQAIINPTAYEKCRNTIENYHKRTNLNNKLAKIECTPYIHLPRSVKRLEENKYLWLFDFRRQPVILKAPSARNVAMFVEIANAVAIEDWGGRAWTLIDAMITNCIDWPAYYRYALHLNRRVDRFTELTKKPILDIDTWEVIPELDWPGIEALHPLSIAHGRQTITPLFTALHLLPASIILPFFHDVRERTDRYTPSSLPSFTENELIELKTSQFADKGFATLIESLSIKEILQIFADRGLPLPTKSSKMKRSVYVEHLRELAQEDATVLHDMRMRVTAIHVQLPHPLNWDTFHALRKQVIWMGKLMYAHLAGETTRAPKADQLLSH